jgi:hypothetical protein
LGSGSISASLRKVRKKFNRDGQDVQDEIEKKKLKLY